MTPMLRIAACCLGLTLAFAAWAEDVLRIGSKRFTESYILGEVVTQTAQPFAHAEHRQGLGNTAIVFEALKAGAIDAYPEYLGTIVREILKRQEAMSLDEINRALAPLGLGAAVPFGFSNGYALAMRGDSTIGRLSGLATHPELRFGLSHEFLGRTDGWPGLARRYGLPQRPVGLDHGLAYEALAALQVDVIDIYTTDAKIQQYGLRVLADDAAWFPRYDALLLYRLDVERRFPQAWRAMRGLEGRIKEADMIAMNAAAELDGKPFAAIARTFLHPQRLYPQRLHPQATGNGVGTDFAARMFDGNLWRLTREHIALELLSVALAAIVGIPLGVLAAFLFELAERALRRRP